MLLVTDHSTCTGQSYVHLVPNVDHNFNSPPSFKLGLFTAVLHCAYKLVTNFISPDPVIIRRERRYKIIHE